MCVHDFCGAILLFIHLLYIMLCVGSGRSGSPSSPTPTNSHPDLMNDSEKNILATKAHLVLRMIQQKIGHDLFLQASVIVSYSVLCTFKHVMMLLHS